MILTICAQQIDEFSFAVFNGTSQQAYDDAGVDLSTVTVATLYFKKVNDLEANEISVDISSLFQYLFEDGGMTIEFEDFGVDTYNGYDYFPDWMYEIRIEYTYDGEEYEASTTVGFKAIIVRVVNQQMLQSNWKKELSCYCGCEMNSSSMRKFFYNSMLDIDANLCLVNEFIATLKALYKVTGTVHEFS